MTELIVNRDRLWSSLMELARIGATDRGGVRRLALTELDREGRDLFVQWCRAEGLDVRVDRVGNIFGRRAGRDADRSAILAGSHLDTQPTGGRFDGAYGVLAALEVVRTLNEHGVETEAPIEVVAWTNEEGTRFRPAMAGSGVYAGVFSLEEVLSQVDDEGVRFADALEAIGYSGVALDTEPSVGGYFEAHIEQGPVLEQENVPIGIVSGVFGVRWFELQIVGRETHAGPTPMAARNDALVAAADVVLAVRRIGSKADDTRGTCGVLRIEPSSINVVPGSVFLTADLRAADGARLDDMERELRREVEETADRNGVDADLARVFAFPPATFHESCVRAVRKAAEALRLEHRTLLSGAAHDAVYLARVAPTGMIFVPCRDGLSHNEAEYASPDQLGAGCQVLLGAVLDRSGVMPPKSTG